MKKLNYLFIGLLGTLFFSMPLRAQNEKFTRSIFSLRVGPSWYTGKWMGITDNSTAYRNSLRKGISWEASYWYTDMGPFEKGVKLGPGVIYQGSSYQENQENGSDKVWMHYIAPQLGLFFFQNRYQIQLSTGIGYQVYSDRSTVYEKPRKVNMDKLAYNLSLSGEYFLTSQWGLSAGLNWIISDSESYSVYYHGKTWDVVHPRDGEGTFGQFSLLFGLNYHF